MEKNTIEFEQIVERGCGMDVHRETVVVTIQGKGIKTVTKSYSTFTTSLLKLRQWLLKHGITHIAMESTGVYWKPIYNVLGDDFTILLVNPRHVKNVPGHKTDKRDSRWLAKLLLAGLLRGSFIPERGIREIRDLTRYRTKLVHQVSSEKNRFLKILEDTNIKLATVLHDVFGQTGSRLVAEILKGDYNPKSLLHLVHAGVKASREDITEALTGHVTEHHRFMLATILRNMARVKETVAEIDARIEQAITPYNEIRELLETIPGVKGKGAIGIIAEIGTDMSCFPDHHHIASWAGMCPGSNESAGKNRNARTTKGNKHLRSLLTEAAWASTRAKGTYLSAKYRNLVGRRGKKRAIIAVGHKILIAAYAMVKDRVPFNELGADYLNNTRKQQLVNHYILQLGRIDPDWQQRQMELA